MFLFLISALADEDLLKLVLECSDLMVSRWKVDHPSDTEEDMAVGLSSEDEAEGLAASPRVARCSFGGPASTAIPAPLEPNSAEDEVLVKKRALKWVKQQVSALLHGEDLPEGAQAREVAEVPYQISCCPKGGQGLSCVSAVL